MNRPCPQQAVAWAVAVLCTFVVARVQAQTPPSQPDAPAGVQAPPLPAIVVTGSSIRQIDAEAALPVIVLHRRDIERSGARTTTELLQQLPAVQGGTVEAGAVGPETHGFAGVSIHDLGEAYTLVLLNGHRLANFGGQTVSGALNAVDLNTIPLAAVERIEVLTEGASALYGADAVGGVVNIITRSGEAINEGTVGFTWPRGGGAEWRLSALKGMGDLQDEGHNLTLSASASARRALPASRRDFARSGLIEFNHRGQRYRFFDGSASGVPGNVYDDTFAELLNPYLQATGHCPPGHVQQGRACDYDYAADVDLLPARDSQSVMASYTKLVAPDSHLRADLLYSQTRSVVHLSPAATVSPYFAVSGYPYVEAGQPFYDDYLPQMGIASPASYMEYRTGDLGRRVVTDRSSLIDVSLKLDGRNAGWDWATGFNHSVSRVEGYVRGTSTNGAVADLIHGGVLNPFVPVGQQSAQALAALHQVAYDGPWTGGRSTLYAFTWQASRPFAQLAGGPATWSVGGNVNQERFKAMPSLFAQALLDPATGEAATASDTYYARLGDTFGSVGNSASRHSVGVFTEWLLPVTPALDWGLGLRRDQDSLSGDAVTGKMHARWRASPTWLWRGSLGTGFKAPSLQQLTAPAQGYGVIGPHACTADLQTVAAGLNAVCASQDLYLALSQGNRDVRPEHSDQGSVGFRFEPSPEWTLGADLWAVNIHDRIGASPETLAFNDPLHYPKAWTTAETASGTELAFNAQGVNLGELHSVGVDFDIATHHRTGLGKLDTRLLATALIREVAQPYPGGPSISTVGDNNGDGASLRWRGAWAATLTREQWAHTLTMRFQSSYRDAPAQVQPIDANGNPIGTLPVDIRLNVAPYVTWDWLSSWRIRPGMQVAIGVNNLLDAPPPLSLATSGKAFIVGYDERYTDPRGRTLVLEARLAF